MSEANTAINNSGYEYVLGPWFVAALSLFDNPVGITDDMFYTAQNVSSWDSGPTMRWSNGTQSINIHVDWHSYAEVCNPKYCDVLLRKSPFNIFLNVVGTLGGVLTVTFLFVRTFIWPALCFACAFESENSCGPVDVAKVPMVPMESHLGPIMRDVCVVSKTSSSSFATHL